MIRCDPYLAGQNILTWRPTPGPEIGGLLARLEIGSGSRVVDAGCGPGRITGWLAERVAPGESTCLQVMTIC